MRTCGWSPGPDQQDICVGFYCKPGVVGEILKTRVRVAVTGPGLTGGAGASATWGIGVKDTISFTPLHIAWPKDSDPSLHLCLITRDSVLNVQRQ